MANLVTGVLYLERFLPPQDAVDWALVVGGIGAQVFFCASLLFCARIRWWSRCRHRSS